MEELQTTEILDREILEDARKKAWRILKSADDAIRAQTAEWDKKTAESLDELHKKYRQRLEMASVEIISRLPMEKRRIRAQAIDALLNQAIQSWYAGLERGYIIGLLKNELKIRLAEYNEFSGSTGRVLYGNLSRNEIDEIVRDLLPGANFPMEEKSANGNFPELIIENDTVRLCASLKNAVDFFLLSKRTELITALLGEEA